MATKKIAIIGNCQAAPLARLLSALHPNFEFVHPAAVHLINKRQVAEFLSQLRRYQAVVTQPVKAGYRDNIGIDTDNLRDHMKPGQQLVLMPNLHFEGYFPTFGYMKYKDGNLRGKALAALLPDATSQGVLATLPRTDYQCYFLLCAWLQGWTVSRTAAVLEKPIDSELVRSWHSDSLAEFAQRESSMLTRMTPILQSLAEHPEYDFQSFNHPNKTLLTTLALQVLRALNLDIPAGGDAKVISQRVAHLPDWLGRTFLPVYPFVASSLGIKERAIAKIKGQEFPLPEFVSNSFAYFDCLGRDGLLVNASHPKFELSQKILATFSAI